MTNVTRAWKQLLKRQQNISSMLIEEVSLDDVLRQYGDWLVLYENFLELHQDVVALYSTQEKENDAQWFQRTEGEIAMFCAKMERWFSCDTQTVTTEKKLLRTHSSHSSRKKKSCSGSSRSSSTPPAVSSARLKEEQCQAALKVKMANLKARKEIEEAKLKLRLKEEEIDIQEKMAVSQAKMEVLSSRESGMSTILDFDSTAKSHRVKEKVSVPEVKTTSGDQNTQSGNAIDSLIQHLNISRLPVPEPGFFDGDPIQYPSWKVAFETLISQKGIPESEKVYYLKHFLRGDAKSCVEGFFLMNSSEAFSEAMKLLEERFGDSFVIASTFRDKLNKWPRIPPRDSKQLLKLVIS